MDLESIFNELNGKHFDGGLPLPKLIWNSRLRATAGRFRPGHRRFGWIRPPEIEVANYLLEEGNAEALVRDTMAHEMIHFWLWVRKRPYGHTEEFHEKMREMGVSRYNPVPRRRPIRYLYACPACLLEFQARRKWEKLACARCCNLHARGRFDARFRLELVRKVTE